MGTPKTETSLRFLLSFSALRTTAEAFTTVSFFRGEVSSPLTLKNSVFTGPGQTAVTKTPFRRLSRRINDALLHQPPVQAHHRRLFQICLFHGFCIPADFPGRPLPEHFPLMKEHDLIRPRKGIVHIVGGHEYGHPAL